MGEAFRIIDFRCFRSITFWILYRRWNPLHSTLHPPLHPHLPSPHPLALRPLPQLLHRTPPATTGRRSLSLYPSRGVRAFGAGKVKEFKIQNSKFKMFQYLFIDGVKGDRHYVRFLNYCTERYGGDEGAALSIARGWSIWRGKAEG
jgi:hypothetical protein